MSDAQLVMIQGRIEMIDHKKDYLFTDYEFSSLLKDGSVITLMDSYNEAIWRV